MANYIYVIENNGTFKVGFSNNPEKRLKTLQTGCTNKLKLIYTENIENAKIHILEKIIHKQLAPYKILGEWFNTDIDTIITEIKFAKIRYDNDTTNLEYKYHVLKY